MRQPIPESPPGFDASRVIERPDGFYWQDPDTGETFGPFATLLDAVNDMNYSADDATGPGESLTEAEDEIGIAGWVDPETGEPAEERVPRIEDH